MDTIVTGDVTPLWVPIASLLVSLLWVAFLGLGTAALVRYLRNSKRPR